MIRKNKEKIPEKLQNTLILSSILFWIFITFTIIALLLPQKEAAFTVSDYYSGLDVVFAIDVSYSMDIRDVQMQSRLERGLQVAVENVSSVPGVRFAAAIGRGRGYLAVPLTYGEAIIDFLESLDSSSMTGRSTNLESLVEAAAASFQNSSPARKVIVLISDGESHFGSLRTALNRCIKEGINVTAVAIGSDRGSPVTAQKDNMPDAVSRRDAAVMRMTAERTGGIYIDGNREDAAHILSAYLLSLAQQTPAAGNKSKTEKLRTLFIILAIIAYSAFKFIPLLFTGKKLPLVSMFAIIFIFTSCSEGRLLLVEANYLFSRGRYDEAITPYLKAKNYKEAAPYAEYGLALTLYSLDEGITALTHYNNSQKILEALSENEHRELRYRNFYNSGIIYFDEGDFLSAADAFKEALRIEPRRIDAKRNLEISLMSISRKASEENNKKQSEPMEILFEYIKQQEQQYWKSREWETEENFPGKNW